MLKNKRIVQIQQICCLGVYIDFNLSWKHYNYAVAAKTPRGHDGIRCFKDFCFFLGGGLRNDFFGMGIQKTF